MEIGKEMEQESGVIMLEKIKQFLVGISKRFDSSWEYFLFDSLARINFRWKKS